METDQLIVWLREQVGCFQALAKLAKLQHDHVEKGRTEDLILVLGRKKDLVERIAELEKQIGPVRKQWAEYADHLSEADVAEARGLMDEAKRFLSEITESDQKDAMVLQQRKIDLTHNIHRASAAQKFNRAYASLMQTAPRGELDLHK